ncbi:MAG: transposase [Thaumarchaeota archaeon]|nr:transposase [Nitrososphaerota archaeon]
MTGKRTRFIPDEKVRIVLQTFNPETSVAELCRRHNLAPRTIYAWKEKFLEGGRSSFEGADAGRRERRHSREVSDLKRIIGEYAVTNAALKNAGGRQRMSAAAMMRGVVGLNRSLWLCGVSKKAWCYKPRPRNVPPDPAVLDTVLRIAPERPAYGARSPIPLRRTCGSHVGAARTS